MKAERFPKAIGFRHRTMPRLMVRTGTAAAIELDLSKQSKWSWTIGFFCLLIIISVALDAPVRAFAIGLDPNHARFLGAVTSIGNGAWPIAIAVVVLFSSWISAPYLAWRERIVVQRAGQLAALLLRAVVISGGLANIAKYGFGRARPMTDIATVLELQPFAMKATWASFPSGHSTTAVATALILSMIWPRLSVAFLSVGIFAALTRAMIGVHWVSDVCAGMALGAVVTFALIARFDAKKSRPPFSERASRVLSGCLRRKQRDFIAKLRRRFLAIR